MTSFWKPAMLAALIATLAFAPASEANTLKMPRAIKANKTFTRLVCKATEGDAACLASRPGRCRRLSQHRARCSFFTTLELEDGSVARCRSLVDWYIGHRRPGLRPNFLGVRSCRELRPPQPVTPPPTEEPAY